MFHKLAFLGSPGSSKSTCGLSYPGVEQHVFGSSEEDTALNFAGRKDILPPVKYDWFDALTDKEKEKFTDEKVSEIEVGLLTKLARARNITRYRRYLYKLKSEIPAGKRPELKTVFLDNGTPFAQEFQDYVEIVYAKDFETKEGNFNSMKFMMKYQTELMDFMRLFYSLPCHTVVSFHVAMSLDEETSANSSFLDDQKKGIRHSKEWQPLIMGKTKFALVGIPTWAFYLWTEESPGHPNKYFAKLEADTADVGVAKSRIQPFDKPSKIELPKNNFYEFFTKAIDAKLNRGAK